MSLQPLNPITLPLQGLQVIEASAGTGKTYTLAALYVRLVLGHGRAQGLAVADVAHDEVTPPHHVLAAGTEIVEHHRPPAALRQGLGRVRADIAGAAGDQHRAAVRGVCLGQGSLLFHRD